MRIKIIAANRCCYIGKIGTVVRSIDSNSIVVYVSGFYESAIVTKYKIIKGRREHEIKRYIKNRADLSEVQPYF